MFIYKTCESTGFSVMTCCFRTQLVQVNGR